MEYVLIHSFKELQESNNLEKWKFLGIEDKKDFELKVGPYGYIASFTHDNSEYLISVYLKHFSIRRGEIIWHLAKSKDITLYVNNVRLNSAKLKNEVGKLYTKVLHETLDQVTIHMTNELKSIKLAVMNYIRNNKDNVTKKILESLYQNRGDASLPFEDCLLESVFDETSLIRGFGDDFSDDMQLASEILRDSLQYIDIYKEIYKEEDEGNDCSILCRVTENIYIATNIHNYVCVVELIDADRSLYMDVYGEKEVLYIRKKERLSYSHGKECKCKRVVLYTNIGRKSYHWDENAFGQKYIASSFHFHPNIEGYPVLIQL